VCKFEKFEVLYCFRESMRIEMRMDEEREDEDGGRESVSLEEK